LDVSKGVDISFRAHTETFIRYAQKVKRLESQIMYNKTTGEPKLAVLTFVNL